MPWWKSLGVMNENKGVFGLNMLNWWDAEGLDRALEPLSAGLENGDYVPVVAEAFPFDRAADAHRFIAERRNNGKVVLTPAPAPISVFGPAVTGWVRSRSARSAP
jgi:NADPH:quinone reductase-like Zn-dependent oxidoreductase